jgi:DNA-binding CsgD family transcriptional regulator
LSTLQVQRELGVSAAQVEELIASRRLPAFRIFGQWRIEREQLERMIDRLYEASDPDRAPVRLAGHVARSTPSVTIPVDPAGTRVKAPPNGVPRIPPGQHTPIPAALTDQQRRILWLIGQAMSNAEIADRLSLEISTVKSHVSRLLQRCALRDREQLIVLAWSSGVMHDDVWRDQPGTDADAAVDHDAVGRIHYRGTDLPKSVRSS